MCDWWRDKLTSTRRRSLRRRAATPRLLLGLSIRLSLERAWLHLDVASCLHLPGELDLLNGDLRLAEPRLQRALALCEAAPGTNTLTLLPRSTASPMSTEMRACTARPNSRWQRAFGVYEENIGPMHPCVALSLPLHRGDHPSNIRILASCRIGPEEPAQIVSGAWILSPWFFQFAKSEFRTFGEAREQAKKEPESRKARTRASVQGLGQEVGTATER